MPCGLKRRVEGLPWTTEQLFSGNQFMSYLVGVIFFEKQEYILFIFWTPGKFDAQELIF
jgi:hypothetical protein